MRFHRNAKRGRKAGGHRGSLRGERLLPFDGVEGAPPRRALAAASSRTSQPTATSGPVRRDLAHGHKRVRALPTARPPCHRRPPFPGSPPPLRGGHHAGASSTSTPRLAYAVIHDDDRAATVTSFLERALAFYAEHEISVRPADDGRHLGLHAKPRRPRVACSRAGPPSQPNRTGRAPTARSSASTKRWRANGAHGWSTTHTANARVTCHTGCTTTPRSHTAR